VENVPSGGADVRVETRRRRPWGSSEDPQGEAAVKGVDEERERGCWVRLGKKTRVSPRPGRNRYIYSPLRLDDPSPEEADHPHLSDRIIQPLIEVTPSKRWVYWMKMVLG
jgi:hypothetical protein